MYNYTQFGYTSQQIDGCILNDFDTAEQIGFYFINIVIILLTHHLVLPNIISKLSIYLCLGLNSNGPNVTIVW